MLQNTRENAASSLSTMSSSSPLPSPPSSACRGSTLLRSLNPLKPCERRVQNRPTCLSPTSSCPSSRVSSLRFASCSFARRAKFCSSQARPLPPACLRSRARMGTTSKSYSKPVHPSDLLRKIREAVGFNATPARVPTHRLTSVPVIPCRSRRHGISKAACAAVIPENADPTADHPATAPSEASLSKNILDRWSDRSTRMRGRDLRVSNSFPPPRRTRIRYEHPC